MARTVIGKAFVNFRVGDADDTAQLIDQQLCRAFGADKVFRSSRAMHGGALFPPTLEAEATDCAVMVVVIGRHWLADYGGRRRIDDPDDWVRREIELALDNDRPVIPVLTGERPRLGPDDNLPPSIAGLIDRPHLTFRSADRDLARIAREVRRHLDTTARPDHPVHLVSLRPTQRSPEVRLGAAEIGGDLYGDSIVFQPFASLISFNLGMRFRRLEVTAAVLAETTEPAQSALFTVIGDGRTLEQVTATQGRPKALTVDVTDVLTLKLTAHRMSDTIPELAWGDPVVYP